MLDQRVYYAVFVLLAPFLRAVAAEAPNVTIHLLPRSKEAARQADLVIEPQRADRGERVSFLSTHERSVTLRGRRQQSAYIRRQNNEGAIPAPSASGLWHWTGPTAQSRGSVSGAGRHRAPNRRDRREFSIGTVSNPGHWTGKPCAGAGRQTSDSHDRDPVNAVAIRSP